MTDNTRTFVAADAGCYLDNHRGHYIQRDMIQLAIEYGYIVGQFEQFAIDMYDSHGHEDSFPNEAMTELADEALEWLNSGQGECEDCHGAGIGPQSGEYWTHKDDPDGIKRCKACTGTGRGERISGQNFPPIIPNDMMWQWNDGDFGLYAMEEEE